jgi:hypothetical protein
MTGAITFEFLSTVLGLVSLIVGAVMYTLQQFGKRDIDLEKYKTHVAETYASRLSVNESLKTIHASIEKLSNRIDLYFSDRN